MPRRSIDQGVFTGCTGGPETECVVRTVVAGHGRSLSITIALDIEAISEQAEQEAEDAPAVADRAWWAR